MPARILICLYILLQPALLFAQHSVVTIDTVDVSDGFYITRKKQWYTITNNTGKVIFGPERCNDVQRISKGCFLVKLNDRGQNWRLVDTAGNKSYFLYPEKFNPADSADHVLMTHDQYGKETSPWGYNGISYGRQEQHSYHDDMRRYWSRMRSGVLDTSGKIIVPFKYGDVSLGNKFIGAVDEDSVYLFSREGALLLQAAYEDIMVLHNDFIAVKLYDLWALMDSSGNVLTPFIYHKFERFNDTLAVVKRGENGLLNSRGVEVIPPIYEQFTINDAGWIIARKERPDRDDLNDDEYKKVFTQDRTWCDYCIDLRFLENRYVEVNGQQKGYEYKYYDTKRRKFIKEIPPHGYGNGTRVVNGYDGELYGIVQNGKQVVPIAYNDIEEIGSRSATGSDYYKLTRTEHYDTRFGMEPYTVYVYKPTEVTHQSLLNRDLEVVVPEGEHEIEIMNADVFSVGQNRKIKYVIHAPSGREIECEYVQGLFGGKLYLSYGENKMSYRHGNNFVITDSTLNILAKGEGFLDMINSNAIDQYDVKDRLAMVWHVDSLHGLISTTGDTLIPPVYNRIQAPTSMYGNRLVRMYKGAKTALADVYGNALFGGQLFDNLFVLSDSTIVYKNDEGKYGMMHKSGHILMPFEYDSFYIGREYIFIEKDNKWGFFSLLYYNMLIPPVFEERPYQMLNDSIVELTDHSYVVFRNGSVVVPDSGTVKKAYAAKNFSLDRYELENIPTDRGVFDQGVYNRRLQRIWPYVNDHRSPGNSRNGRLLVMDSLKKNTAVIDTNGTVLVPLRPGSGFAYLGAECALFLNEDSSLTLYRFVGDADVVVDSGTIDSTFYKMHWGRNLSNQEVVMDLGYTKAILLQWPSFGKTLYLDSAVEEVVVRQQNGSWMEIKKNGKWGLLDWDFSELLQPVYDSLGLSKQGYYLYRSGKMGCYYKQRGGALPQRKIYLEPVYDSVGDMKTVYNGFVSVKRGSEWLLIDDKGNELTAGWDSIIVRYVPYSLYAYKAKQKYVLTVSREGKFEYSKDTRPDINGNCQYWALNGCVVTIKGKKGLYSTEDDRWLVPPIYDDVTPANANCTVAEKGNCYTGDVCVSYIFDHFGNKVFTYKGSIDQVNVIGSYHWLVETDSLQFVIEHDGSVVVPPKYQWIDYIAKEVPLFTVWMTDDSVGFVNLDGELVTPPVINVLGQDILEGGYQRAFSNNFYSIISPGGKMITDPVYDEVYSNVLNNTPGGKPFFFVVKDNLWGIVNSKGKEIFPCIYDSVKQVYNERYVVLKKGDKWGVASIQGKLMIPFEYDYISGFAFSKALYRKGGEQGAIMQESNKLKIHTAQE